jgi:hypothetical protein
LTKLQDENDREGVRATPVELPAYAPWELPTMRRLMPAFIQHQIGAVTPYIRVDQRAYDKHTVGKHADMYQYLHELNEVLENWKFLRPGPSKGGKWEIYSDINDDNYTWILTVLGESRGGFNLVSIHSPRTSNVWNRVAKDRNFIMRKKE